MSLISARKVCTDGVRWVLNFRRTIPCPDRRDHIYSLGPLGLEIERAVDLIAAHDGHSGGSMAWTVRQSQIIDEQGWDEWLTNNRGYLCAPEESFQ